MIYLIIDFILSVNIGNVSHINNSSIEMTLLHKPNMTHFSNHDQQVKDITKKHLYTLKTSKKNHNYYQIHQV